MDAEFWHQRWQENEIGFHQHEVNPLLKKYFARLQLLEGSRVLVPLCGKSHDLSWIAAQGYEVIGVELSELATESYFKELGKQPSVTQKGKIKSYGSDNIEIFVADIFSVDADLLHNINAVYDRAALVALPEKTRIQYTKHLLDATANAPQLLITYEYDQSLMNGPPFSISDDQVAQYYGNEYNISLLKTLEADNRLKKISANEKVWLLK